ncbi:hypothetical protein N24_0127 [Corynebacterium suranareeae]|uniref:Uncharacterized protein n=1 Tax=Corynebacterium suranareeae TaxID=2506452 RepID=A0A160PL72_9CORY|nr:hypothetical protein N24_0127 [Corynebacterium suranareeae]
MPSTPRRAAIAVAAVLTAVTLVACSVLLQSWGSRKTGVK